MTTERKLRWCIEQVEKAQNALLEIVMRQMVGATSESIRAAAGISTTDLGVK